MIKINPVGYDVVSFLYIQEKNDKYNEFLTSIIFGLHLNQEGFFYDNGNFETRSCKLNESDLNTLIKFVAETQSELLKALSYDILHTQTKRNEHAKFSAQNYISFLSSHDNCDVSIIRAFCKRIIKIYNKDNKIFKNDLIIVKEYVLSLLSKKKIDNLDAHNILSTNKYITKKEQSLFARKFYKNALLLRSGLSLALERKFDDFRLSNIIQNINLSFEFAVKLYKMINNSKLTNKLYFKSLISYYEFLKMIDCETYSKSSILCILLAEQSMKMTTKGILRDNNFNIASFELNMQKKKSSLISNQESIHLDMSNIISYAEDAVSGTKNFHQSLNLLSKYTCNVSHLHINKEDEPFTTLFQQIAITPDGRTSAIGDESRVNTIVYYSLHGLIIRNYRINIQKKYNIEKECLNKMIQESINIPQHIKNFVFIGLERWLLDDIISSSFILVPLYEALVRDILKKENISTQTNNNGSQDEKSLSGLINDELEKSDILNKEFIFEIKELMIEKTGSNLRNKISHAIINDDEINSPLYDFICWRWLTIITGDILLKK
ncbi:TPA: DUF4209 domain-containing protein [Yersinia enterocolitica]|uniref:DUF4209 domain-containing protein n=1 Tax=Yersinia enterocolitica TaxID=630 RepID=UPI0005DF26AE|nr:DUF4209 domain-containing protein [Yersinia enterocolitica]CQJ65069.1 Uncharacterised protein [Yersinia enterocolitica]